MPALGSADAALGGAFAVRGAGALGGACGALGFQFVLEGLHPATQFLGLFHQCADIGQVAEAFEHGDLSEFDY